MNNRLHQASRTQQRRAGGNFAPARDDLKHLLTRRCVRWLFHFTPIESLTRIRTNGLIPDVDGIDDQLILSVSHPDTMALYHQWRNPADAYAILRIAVQVCWMLDSEFWCKGRCLSTKSAGELAKLFSDSTDRRDRPGYYPRHWPTHPCLQVRVRNRIAPSMIVAIALRDRHTARKHEGLLERLPVWIDPALFCARRPKYYE